MTSTQKGGEEVLKFVVCLQVLLFLNNRSIVLFCKSGVSAGEEGGGGGGGGERTAILSLG